MTVLLLNATVQDVAAQQKTALPATQTSVREGSAMHTAYWQTLDPAKRRCLTTTLRPILH